MSKVYSSIPDPGDDVEALKLTIVALKQNMEILMGDRGPNGWANQNFVQPEAPVAAKEGDKWYKLPVLPTDAWVTSIWKNGKWLVVG